MGFWKVGELPTQKRGGNLFPIFIRINQAFFLPRGRFTQALSFGVKIFTQFLLFGGLINSLGFLAFVGSNFLGSSQILVV